MSLIVRQSSRSWRDVKRLLGRGVDLSKLKTVIEALVDQKSREDRYRDRSLVGGWKGYRECHVQPDWLLIYRVTPDELQLVRTGSQSELFG